MKDTDVVIIVAFVAQMQPAQKFNAFTPDAWSEVLADIPADLEMARAAVVRLAKRQNWFTPGEIRSEIRAALPPSAMAAPAPVRAIMRGDEGHAQDRIERNRRGADAARAAVKPFPGGRPIEEAVPENLRRAREAAAAQKAWKRRTDPDKLGRAGAELLSQINRNRSPQRGN
jgi:hypothetical protein